MSTSKIKVIQVVLYETKHYIQYVNDHESDHVSHFCGEILSLIANSFLINGIKRHPVDLCFKTKSCWLFNTFVIELGEKILVGDVYFSNKVSYNCCKF